MFKLDLEKAEEREIKLPTSVGSSKKARESSRKTSASALLTTPKPFCLCGSQQTVENSSRGGNTKPPTHLRNLYARQEATVRTGHRTTDWFQIGKEVHQGCILSPCLFNLYAEYIIRNTGLESRLPGEISITSDMQMTPPLWQKEKRIKEPLDESENEKSD